MSLRALSAPRFIRRTSLGPDEYRKNFRQIDRDAIEAVTSREADQVTSLMSKIYLRLVNAPDAYWEREGVLRFEAEQREAGQVKAWSVLCEVLGVASATASKALHWMHEQGIIGYFAGKNGVGIRIFLNRAASSVGKKILRFPPASTAAARASLSEPASNDSFAVSEVLEPDINPRAPQNGAEAESTDSAQPADTRTQPHKQDARRENAAVRGAGTVCMDELVARLRRELEPCVRAAATEAAARASAHEIARTREWFETKALPKAVRVAQHETYGLLRRYGGVDEKGRRAVAGSEAERNVIKERAAPVAHRLTPDELREAAEICVALWEAQGRAIEVTLAEISSGAHSWLLPEDAPRVREVAQALLAERGDKVALKDAFAIGL